MQKYFLLATERGDFAHRIDAGGGGRADGGDDRKRLEAFSLIRLDCFGQSRNVHAKIGIARDANHVLLAKTKRDGGFLDRTVRLIGSVNSQTRDIVSTGQTFRAHAIDRFFTRHGQRMHDSYRGRVVNNAAKLVRQTEPLPQPIQNERFQLGRSRRRAPGHGVDVERC